MLPETTIS